MTASVGTVPRRLLRAVHRTAGVPRSAPAGFDLVLLDRYHQPIGTLARAVMSKRQARRARDRKALFLGVPRHLIAIRRHDNLAPCDLIDRPGGVLHDEPTY